MNTFTTHVPSRTAVRPDGNIPALSANTGRWRDVVSYYIAQKQGKHTTRTAYAKALHLFFNWVESTGRDWTRLSKIDLLAYVDYLQDPDRQHSSLTVNLYVVAIRGFYKWVDHLTLNPHIPNIAEDITIRHKRNKFQKKALSVEQATELLRHFHTKITAAASPSAKRNAMRDYAMVNLMLRTGLRTVEVSGVNIQHLTQVRGQFSAQPALMVMGKGKNDFDDFVILSEETYAPIRDYLATRSCALSGEPLFVCEGRASKGRRLSTRRIQAIVKEGLRAIGLTDYMDKLYSAHSLRHTAGSLILEAGGSVFDVQKMLRHSNPATSEIYVKEKMQQQRIDNAPEHLLDHLIKSPEQEYTLC